MIPSCKLWWKQIKYYQDQKRDWRFLATTRHSRTIPVNSPRKQVIIPAKILWTKENHLKAVFLKVVQPTGRVEFPVCQLTLCLLTRKKYSKIDCPWNKSRIFQSLQATVQESRTRLVCLGGEEIWNALILSYSDSETLLECKHCTKNTKFLS